MRGSLILNFLVLENTVARATRYGEHSFGKDDENSSVSGDEHNEPVKYWPFKTVFYFHAILRERREVVKKPLVKVNHEDSLFPVSGLVTDQTGQNMCLYDDKSFRNKTTDRLQHYPHWLIIFIDRDNELTITFNCII